MSILSLFILIPLLILALILTGKKTKNALAIAVTGMTLQLILSGLLVLLYLSEHKNDAISEMLFFREIPWFGSMNIHFAVGADGLTVIMVVLVSIVALAALLSTGKNDHLPKRFWISFLILVSAASGFVVSTDLILMFTFLVAAFLQVFFIEDNFGNGHKHSPPFKHCMVLMGGAAILLIGILGIYTNSAPDGNDLTFNSLLISKYIMPLNAQKVFFVMVLLGFCVAGALFPFGIWFSQCCDSTPAVFRIFYTGVLMKLGVYGAFRVGITLMPEGAREMTWFFLILSAAAVIYGTAGTFMQKELRKMHAYASVSFSGMIFYSLLLLNEKAMAGALLMLLSHGLVATMLFSLTGLLEERYQMTKTNEKRRTATFIRVSWIAAVLALIGIPGSVGFVAVKTIFAGVIQEAVTLQRIAGLLLLILLLIMTLYIMLVSLRMITGSQTSSEVGKPVRILWQEKITVAIIMIPVITAGIMPSGLVSMIESTLQPVIQRIIEINPFRI